MSNELADDIGQYLQDQSLVTVGTDLFKGGFAEDGPDAAVALKSFPGRPPLRVSGGLNAVALLRPHLQVVCRGGPHDQKSPWAKANTIKAKLQGLGPITINGRTYQDVNALGESSETGRDTKDRVLVTTNYEVARGN